MSAAGSTVKKPPRSSYAAVLGRGLKPAHRRDIVALDLFAGCGGLALGFESEGFETIGFEIDEDACATYRRNLRGECKQARLSPAFNYPSADVVIGGPPCQPFSVGGKQLGNDDDRNGFPAFIAAVRSLKPAVWLFENVRGLFYRNRWYLNEVIDELRSIGYVSEFKLLNARHFGVAQNRERVVVVGHRGGFMFPDPWPSEVSAGEALGSLARAVPPESRFLTPSMDKYVSKYERASKCINPRDLHLDRPARTLTCRNLAGATGDMQRIRLADGRRRRLLLREAARLQSFPDWFEFSGGEISRFNQVGNAVPPLLAKALARQVRAAFLAGPSMTPDEIHRANRRATQMALFA